jgi:adenylosuccinate lyase
MELGLPITQEQIDEMEANIDNVDFDAAAKYERELRHDVMAHIHAWGDQCPKAMPIIHLGATSCYVGDNTDIIVMKEALGLVRTKLVNVIAQLSRFAETYKDLPTLAFTHFQPAQPTTVGKRAALWIYEFLLDLENLEYVSSTLKLLGSRGTTGTEASFMDLFEGDAEKIDLMNRMIADSFGFDECFSVSGQTYPRKTDVRIMNALSSVAQSCYRMAQDIRLLQHDRQLEEPFEKDQIGSSAMAYKRNPMRCERICSLARYLMVDALNAVMTAQSQWLERTLDDSANRRVSLPEGFLCCDSILRIAKNVTSGLVVNEKVIEKTLKDYMPFIATENIMMEAVKRGGDRQKIHEIIRKCSMEATKAMKEGRDGGLIKRLLGEEQIGLTQEELEIIMDPLKYTGRCAEQVEKYVEYLTPLIGDAEAEDEDLDI